MKNRFILSTLIVISLALFSCVASQKITVTDNSLQGQTYFARCNLKILKGNYITWVNWQSAPTFIPVGTPLRIESNGEKVTIKELKTGRYYTLDVGAKGNIYLEKFITKNPVDITQFPDKIQNHIKNAVARIGMSKEQVYYAMGPPAWADEKTNLLSYEDIMDCDLWVYKRRRFGKNIGVAFDFNTGKVNNTEGIWR